MELKEYVSTVIEQICQGVINAQRNCGTLDAIVNPRVTLGENGEYYIPQDSTRTILQRRVQSVEIEATLTESTSDSHGGHVGLSVSFVGGKLGGDHADTRSSTNRVKFTIPICFPTSDVV